jgi:hypothetical protein
VLGPGCQGGRRCLYLFGARSLSTRKGVGHAQVGAEHVDDGLTVFRVVLSQALKGVQGAEPDRGLLVAELLDGLCVQLGDAPLSGVDLI